MSTQPLASKLFYKDNFLTYYTTHNINQENSNIDRLVIVVHGALRNGDEYFADTVIAAKKHGVQNNTMIIAPHFRRQSDKREKGEIYYGNHWTTKWKYGYDSQDSDKVSSFTLIDTLIKRIYNSNLFPNLKNIVITGHSAGGQFTQRYAIGSKVQEDVSAKVSFVPSNPSSYMYLDKERYFFRDGNYTLNNKIKDCPLYNEYIYGPANRANYLAKYSVQELKSIYKNNKVTYLMSEEDKGSDSLDRSCEAMTQGKNRFERSQNFWYYDKKKGLNTNHHFVGIADIAHEHKDVYSSLEAGSLVFGLPTKKDSSFLYRKIGNSKDVQTNSKELYLLLGGGKNEIIGFSKFLSAANAGDILVISAKEELGQRYTHDLWNMAQESEIKIDSVETISFLNREAGQKEFVINKIKNAEAIFFTGGDQSKYINRIKGTLAHEEIIKKIKIGTPLAGTSAGLAIMGEYIFSAKAGGLSSKYVLKNPHANEITIENDFFKSNTLKSLITDTHFMNRNRQGRLLGFMFRAQYDFSLKSLYAVGIDEQSSLLLTSDSMSAQGGVYFYKHSNNNSPRTQANKLNYGPIKKLKLNSEFSYPHYGQLDFSEASIVEVKEGVVL